MKRTYQCICCAIWLCWLFIISEYYFILSLTVCWKLWFDNFISLYSSNPNIIIINYGVDFSIPYLFDLSVKFSVLSGICLSSRIKCLKNLATLIILFFFWNCYHSSVDSTAIIYVRNQLNPIYDNAEWRIFPHCSGAILHGSHSIHRL